MAGHTYPQLTSSLTLAAVPTAAGVARSFVRQHLSQWGLNQLTEDAELVLSELVANAVTATGSTNPRPRWGDLHDLALIGIRLVVTVDSLVIEVWDRSPSPPVPRLPEQADEEGRGLLIVDALCRRWNYFYHESGGKAVWGRARDTDYDLVPAGLPKRHNSRLVFRRPAQEVPSVETLERVLEGLRRI
jgi:anti-sigma regulatory factor (Ser/Thr protein kinase)